MRFRFAAGVLAALALAGPTHAGTTYHVAAGACSHGTAPGSDAADGTTRATAFATVQRCLDLMRGGDACLVHTGTYVGDHTCCGHGDRVYEPPRGTALAPTRILGAEGDDARLVGTGNEPVPVGETNAYLPGIAALTVKAGGFSDGAAWIEVGNFRITPGRGGALAIPRARGFYVHDITVEDVSAYEPPTEVNNQAETNAVEGTGVIWLWGANDGLVERVRVSNGGAIRVFHPLHAGGNQIRFRLIDVADFQGAVNQGHGADAQVYEYVTARNHRPFTKDDGGLIHLYNSSQTVVRYVESDEAPNPDSAPFYFMGSRRSTNPTPCTNGFGPASAYFSHLTMTGDGSDADAPIGTSGQQPDGCGVNDWRAYDSAFRGFESGLNLVTNPGAGSAACGLLDFAYNAYIGIPTPVKTKDAGCGYGTRTEPGRVVVPAGDEARIAASLVDAGNPEQFGPTPLFPVPEGGGTRGDIGARESGAGAWPYAFQLVATVDTPTPRICWSLLEAGCDLVIPAWDPSEPDPAGRQGVPAWFQVQIDPDGSFASGGPQAAPGFGPLFDSGAVAGAGSFTVPEGVLAAGRSYYVQLRLAETPAAWSGTGWGNGGWGPWSLGFYRFAVADGGGGGTVHPRAVGGVKRLDRKP